MIMLLVIVVAGLTANKLFEHSVTIRIDDSKEYTLRMLSGGNLIFEENGLLLLASHQDYWGDMDVRSVAKVGERRISVTMSDGTQLIIRMGGIEVRAP